MVKRIHRHSSPLVVCSGIRAVEVVGVFLMLLVVMPARIDALKCKCLFGRVVQATPRCRCACFAGYFGEQCNFHIIENVRIDMYVAVKSWDFRADPFVSRLGEEILTEKVEFRYAVPLDKWNKTNVLLGIPGYAVLRLLEAVERIDPWTTELHIESAYVVPLAPRLDGLTTGQALEISGYRFTLDRLCWLLAAMGVFFVLFCLECTFFFKNDEYVIAELGYELPSAATKYKPGPLDAAQIQEEEPDRRPREAFVEA